MDVFEPGLLCVIPRLSYRIKGDQVPSIYGAPINNNYNYYLIDFINETRILG